MAETGWLPRGWLTVAIWQFTQPSDVVWPWQLCALLPLPSVSVTVWPSGTGGLPPSSSRTALSVAGRLLAMREAPL